MACSRQQFQPAAVGSCGRQQWAGCGQTLAVRQRQHQAAAGKHFQAGGSGTRQQQAVVATGSSKYIAVARGKRQDGSRQVAVSRLQ